MAGPTLPELVRELAIGADTRVARILASVRARRRARGDRPDQERLGAAGLLRAAVRAGEPRPGHPRAQPEAGRPAGGFRLRPRGRAEEGGAAIRARRDERGGVRRYVADDRVGLRSAPRAGRRIDAAGRLARRRDAHGHRPRSRRAPQASSRTSRWRNCCSRSRPPSPPPPGRSTSTPSPRSARISNASGCCRQWRAARGSMPPG